MRTWTVSGFCLFLPSSLPVGHSHMQDLTTVSIGATHAQPNFRDTTRNLERISRIKDCNSSTSTSDSTLAAANPSIQSIISTTQKEKGERDFLIFLAPLDHHRRRRRRRRRRPSP
ncbi:hypothetical protein BKA80DRAFT_72599 [Phyllosticta citrichinensis]